MTYIWIPTQALYLAFVVIQLYLRLKFHFKWSFVILNTREIKFEPGIKLSGKNIFNRLLINYRRSVYERKTMKKMPKPQEL